MAKEQYQTRLDSDVAERVEQYRENHDLTSAEAVRRLVAAGLEGEAEPTREKIAADLKSVNEAVDEIAADLDGLRDDLEEPDAEADEFEGMAKASINERARLGGGILIFLLGLLVGGGVLGVVEVGLI